MNRVQACLMGILWMSCVVPMGCQTPSTGGAVPAAAGAPGTPASSTTAPGAVPAAAPPAGKHAALKAKLKNSFICKLFKELFAPFSALAGQTPGGLTMPTPAELNAPGAEGTAAKIKKETIESKQRREAVAFLGTVDCHYYPEAADSMINALRTDRTECVRLEAAIALGKGCCCNKKVIEALALTVSASEADGNPAENSPRVREAARVSLVKCLACYSKVEAVEEPRPLPRPEVPSAPAAEPKKITQMSYYESSHKRSIHAIYAFSRDALRKWEEESRHRSHPGAEDGLFDLMSSP